MAWHIHILFTCLLISSNLNFSNPLNTDLIFSLQKYFNSHVILLPKELENENLTKKLMKKAKVLVGVFNFESLDFSDYYNHKNAMLILPDGNLFLEKLRNFTNVSFSLMASFIWINFFKNTTKAEELKLLTIPYNTKFLVAKKINLLSYEIVDVYQIGSNSSKISSHFAIWENNTLTPREGDFFNNRMNLKGHEFQIANFPTETSNDRKRLFLWRLFSERMNFTLNIRIASYFSTSLPNGTKTGIFELLSENIVESGTDNFVVSNNRLDSYDFIFPTKISHSKLYVAAPHGLNWASLIAPFHFDVWTSIIAWISCASFLTFIMKKIQTKYHFNDTVFNFITAFCNQGRCIKSTNFSIYICGLMPYLLAMVLYGHYSGILLSYLTVQDSSPPFKTLKEVINDGTYKIACNYPSFAWSYINAADNADMKKVRELLLPREQLMTFLADTQYHDLCNHRRVLFTNTVGTNVKVNCSIVEIPDKILGDNSLGIIVRKGFPYRKIMCKLVKHFVATGFWKLYSKNMIKKSKSDYDIQPLSLDMVFPVFFILVSLTCLSLFVLVFEMIFWDFKKKKRIGSETVSCSLR